MKTMLRKKNHFVGFALIVICFSVCFSSCSSTSVGAGAVVPTQTPNFASEVVIPEPVTTFTPDLQTYLPNPGIGWQNDHSHEEIFPYFPETIYYPVRSDVAWKKLNPAKGVYDWSALDEKLNLAVQEKKQFSFRVYTMIYREYGHMVPDWVVAEGATFTPVGDPDYSNCTYQQDWGVFVNALLERYDGNPNIAFIDISGYGDFNEWSWLNHQTAWDKVWEEAYDSDSAGPASMTELDAQARRRMADMFIGGSFEGHQCRDASGQLFQTNYSYKGAAHTQLVMPFAGVRQSIQYVFLQRPDVGFRYDCLGRPGSLDAIPDLVGDRWKSAPVVFELCGEETDDLQEMQALLQAAHGSVVHNNAFSDLPSLQSIIVTAGYRYYLESANIEPADTAGSIFLTSTWRNIGNAPNYPKMGQDFELHVYLLDEKDNILADDIVSSDISTWLPDTPQTLVKLVELPSNSPPGIYLLKVSIVDKRTGKPIYLAFGNADEQGKYFVASFEYK